ncbi:MAG: TMEM175 family protein [Flavobacteriales bacterium]
MSTGNETFREEVKKEFQLERMILFSDAVFAIVITLMAMEIRLPEGTDLQDSAGLRHAVKILAPVIIAYMVSFFFIGAIWYQHLRMFSVLKSYDRGLVVRNLVLLFLIGLFPFSATVITHSKGSVYALTIYLGIIYACVLAQYVLHHYILVRRPALLIPGDISVQLQALRRRKVIVITIGICFALIFITRGLITDPDLKVMATWWMLLVPIAVRAFAGKNAVAEKA